MPLQKYPLVETVLRKSTFEDLLTQPMHLDVEPLLEPKEVQDSTLDVLATTSSFCKLLICMLKMHVQSVDTYFSFIVQF